MIFIMIQVSVMITTYNLEEYIEETLDSVLRQKTDFEYEILIGDDGSADATLDIVKKVRKRTHVPIAIYVMSREQGKKYNPIYRASRNRLNLLKHAKGEYITFLDGDDWYLSDLFLQKGFDILSHNRQYIMCGGDLVRYNQSSRSNPRINGGHLKEGKLSKKCYWGGGYWIPAECFLYRNIYKYGNKIAMNHNVFDDNLIVFYFMKYGDIYYIDEAMVAYRQNMTPWKEKSELEQYLYSAMDIYEEIRMNPRMRRQVFMRHSNQLKILFENISKLQMQKFDRERLLCKRNRYTILEWILCYKEIRYYKRLLLQIFRCDIRIMRHLQKIERKIYERYRNICTKLSGF